MLHSRLFQSNLVYINEKVEEKSEQEDDDDDDELVMDQIQVDRIGNALIIHKSVEKLKNFLFESDDRIKIQEIIVIVVGSDGKQFK